MDETEAPLPKRRQFLLSECVQAYLPMDDQLRAEFAELLKAEPYQGVRAVNKTVAEQTRDETLRETLREQLSDRFGPLPPEAAGRLEAMSYAQLKSLVKQVLRANSLKDLGLADD